MSGPYLVRPSDAACMTALTMLPDLSARRALVHELERTLDNVSGLRAWMRKQVACKHCLEEVLLCVDRCAPFTLSVDLASSACTARDTDGRAHAHSLGELKSASSKLAIGEPLDCKRHRHRAGLAAGGNGAQALVAELLGAMSADEREALFSFDMGEIVEMAEQRPCAECRSHALYSLAMLSRPLSDGAAARVSSVFATLFLTPQGDPTAVESARTFACMSLDGMLVYDPATLSLRAECDDLGELAGALRAHEYASTEEHATASKHVHRCLARVLERLGHVEVQSSGFALGELLRETVAYASACSLCTACARGMRDHVRTLIDGKLTCAATREIGRLKLVHANGLPTALVVPEAQRADWLERVCAAECADLRKAAFAAVRPPVASLLTRHTSRTFDLLAEELTVMLTLRLAAALARSSMGSSATSGCSASQCLAHLLVVRLLDETVSARVAAHEASRTRRSARCRGPRRTITHEAEADPDDSMFVIGQ